MFLPKVAHGNNYLITFHLKNIETMAPGAVSAGRKPFCQTTLHKHISKSQNKSYNLCKKIPKSLL
jgi:hypothetical protein